MRKKEKRQVEIKVYYCDLCGKEVDFKYIAMGEVLDKFDLHRECLEELIEENMIKEKE